MTWCRVQPAIFVLLRLVSFLQMKELGPQQHLHVQLQKKRFKLFGERATRASRASRAGSTGGGWGGCRCAMLPSCLHSGCDSTSATSTCRGLSAGTAGETPGRTGKTSEVTDWLMPQEILSTVALWGSGRSHQTPLPAAPLKPGSFTLRDQVLGQAMHGRQSKGFLLSLSSSSPGTRRTAGIRTHPVPPARPSLPAGAVQWALCVCVYRLVCL